MSSVPTAACRCGSAATRRTGCAARTTAGSTTTPASASRCRRNRRRAASVSKIKLTSYPLIERGGILWTYMGPPELTPAGACVRMGGAAGVALLPRQALAGIQLAAGDGRRHQLQPRLVAALRRHAPRPAAQGHQGRALPARPQAEVRDRGVARRALHRRAPQRRGRPLLLAHHPVDHALVHHGPALRRQRAQRACLGADRRRELLHLDVHLSSDPAALRDGA